MSGPKKPQGAAYKRSWKNYLLNSRYQLRFTGFLVMICALLMITMGWWADDIGDKLNTVSGGKIEGKWPSVMSEASSATKVGIINLQGASFSDDVAADDAARNREIGALKRQQSQLEWGMVGAVVLLCGGLFVFGILMTHKVAGPLYKVGLYLDKMKAGKFDKVYNLRKGDQLMSFFDHFKEAHTALRKVQESDVQHLKELIAAAEKNEAAKSPQLAALVAELRAVVARKEAGLV
jgi:hypothetical protein